jgi:ubiquinone biosynthesis protein
VAEKGKVRRAVELTVVARRAHLLRALREIGVVRARPPTRDGAVRFSEALEELGTTFVKLGQLLSSRPDLLPDVYIEELEKLVDDVSPLPFAPLRDVIDEDIGLEHFALIDERPLASGSIAQIHPALLKSGREVVVKVRRPGIGEQVELDLDLLRRTAALAEKRFDAARLLQLNALADELEQHLHAELNFMEEANNATLIDAVLTDFRDYLFVPQVIQRHLTPRVMIMDRVHGRKVDVDHGLGRERAVELAEELLRAYIRQVTVEGIYHADPHRGNILLTADGRLALLDFGLIGRVDDDTRTALALLLMAIAQNRADDVADLILSLSRTSAESDGAGFVHDLRRKLPRYQWRPLSTIRTGEALADLQRLSLQYGIGFPTSFALVGKTLAQAESIARTLDPSLDPVATVRKEGWSVMTHEIERRLEPNQMIAFTFTQLEPLLRLPRRTAQLLQKVEAGNLKLNIAPVQVEHFESLLRSTANRIGAALIVSALLVASALMARVDHTLAVVCFFAAAALGLYMLWRIMRTPGGL